MKPVSKLLLWITLGLFLIFIAYLLSRKNRLIEELAPQLQIATLSITELSEQKAKGTIVLQLDNKLPLGIRIDSLHYTIFINEKEVVKSIYSIPFRVKANAISGIEVPVVIYYDKLVTFLKNLDRKGVDSVQYKVNATAYTNYRLLRKIRMNTNRRLPLIRIPDVSVRDLDIRKLKFSGGIVAMDVLIRNRNVFKLGFKDIIYTIRIEDRKPAEGKVTEEILLEPMDSTIVELRSKVDWSDLGKGLGNLIFNPDKLDYKFTLQARLISDHEFLKNTNIVITARGPLNDVNDIVRNVRKGNKERKKQERKN